MNPPDLHEALLPYFRSWKRNNIYFGPETERTLLKESGRLFPAACIRLEGDWRSGEESLPLLSVRITSRAMLYRFPYNYQDRRKRGELNADFLKQEALLREHMFPALQNLGTTPAHVMFSMPRIAETEGLTSSEFCSRLGIFLAALPRSYSYALEIANTGFRTPRYFACLASHQVVHVIADRTGGQPLLDQAQNPYLFTGDGVVVMTRADDSPLWQLGIIELVRRCVSEKKKLFCYVEEGRGVRVLRKVYAVMEMMDGDLAKLSYIKKGHAA